MRRRGLEDVADRLRLPSESAVAAFAGAEDADAVADLRAGWDAHIAFGLANPGLSAHLHDPTRATASSAAAAGLEVLRARVHRVAASGRLRVAERRAVELVHAAGTGVVLTLLELPPRDRDLGLADAAWAAVALSVLGEGSSPPAGNATATAVLLRAVLPELPGLSDAERALMAEWLDRSIGLSTGP